MIITLNHILREISQFWAGLTHDVCAAVSVTLKKKNIFALTAATALGL